MLEANLIEVPKKYSHVPKADRISYYQIFCQVTNDVGKLRWVRVSCDWRCLFAECKKCQCSCHGENHQSEGLKAISENVIWNWPNILKDYLENFQNEAWNGVFKIKVNWSALKNNSIIDTERDLERKGIEYREKLKALMEIAIIDPQHVEGCREFIWGKIKNQYRKTERILSQNEKISNLLSLGLSEKEIPLEKEETLEEKGIVV